MDQEPATSRLEAEDAAPADPRSGLLIVNADDWGRDRETTDRALDCIRHGAVSSVSAMAFMADSERAAGIARERRIDVGLHINFTEPFSAPRTPEPLAFHQERLSRFLLRSRFAEVVFHPGLSRSFEYVMAAQREEFMRLYGRAAGRLDGHHHMHLCSNVLLAGLLPRGTVVRRNFSFQPGEKSLANRLYRRVVDHTLARRHRLTDFFFSLRPLAPRERLQRIFNLSRRFIVELEAHPSEPSEYAFLAGDGIRKLCAGSAVAPYFGVR